MQLVFSKSFWKTIIVEEYINLALIPYVVQMLRHRRNLPEDPQSTKACSGDTMMELSYNTEQIRFDHVYSIEWMNQAEASSKHIYWRHIAHELSMSDSFLKDLQKHHILNLIPIVEAYMRALKIPYGKTIIYIEDGIRVAIKRHNKLRFILLNIRNATPEEIETFSTKETSL